MRHVTAWGIFWFAWAMAGLFVELYWVMANSVNTLSNQVWGIERIDLKHPFDFAEWTPLHWLMAVALWTFFAWLSLHLPFGILR